MSDEIIPRKKLLKETKKYEEDKLIKIEGEGEKGHTIYYGYLAAFKDGYNMTIEEACNYLSCSYTYFVTHMIDKVYHIRINTAARKLLFLYAKMYSQLNGDLVKLFNKRILLHREDFFSYIHSTILVEQQYKVFTYDDFNESVLDSIQKNLDTYNKKVELKSFEKTLISLFYDVISTMSKVNEPMQFALPADHELPVKYYSLREIKDRWGLKHDIEVYRIVDANGARKYMLCNGVFVRYDLREIERKENVLISRPQDVIKIDYQSYLRMSNRYEDVAAEILSKALGVSKKLAE